MPDLSQLRKFRHKVPFCSQSALEGILDLASKEGIPENFKRKQIRQSVEQTIESLNTYGPLLVAATAMTLAEEPMEIVFANIFSYIAGAYAAGGCFANFLEEVHSKNPSGYNNPWHCVLYADEIHPGNQLAGSSRKSWALYLSFAEFGSMLSHSELWFTIFVMRSDLVGKLAANIGQIYRLVLEHMFNNQQAHPHAGVLFHRGAARLKLFWTVGTSYRMELVKSIHSQTDRMVDPGYAWLARTFLSWHKMKRKVTRKSRNLPNTASLTLPMTKKSFRAGTE